MLRSDLRVANTAVVGMFVAGIMSNDREISALKRVWKEAAMS